jgi:hypothetical protein
MRDRDARSRRSDQRKDLFMKAIRSLARKLARPPLDITPPSAEPPHADVTVADAASPPAPLPVVAFDVADCTLLTPPSDEQQAAFRAHLSAHRTRDGFWEHATSADWMLDLLRQHYHYATPVTPERELRLFALECASGRRGADSTVLLHLLEGVRRRAAGRLSLKELEALQRHAQPAVTPAGVQGLPRCAPQAAGALAAWHTATPNPYEAAFWAAEYAALHDAFTAVQQAASAWAWPEDRGEPWRASWRAAFFDTARPHVRRHALQQARLRQSWLLKRILPQPFGGPYAVRRLQ